MLARSLATDGFSATHSTRFGGMVAVAAAVHWNARLLQAVSSDY